MSWVLWTPQSPHNGNRRSLTGSMLSRSFLGRTGTWITVASEVPVSLVPHTLKVRYFAEQSHQRGSDGVVPVQPDPPTLYPYDTSHIAMAYTALACLLILGDDLSRVNRTAVLAGIRRLQLPNGSFYSTAEGGENDMRFVYCAVSVCYMLQDWSAMDRLKTAEFIKSSQVRLWHNHVPVVPVV
jgi:hypothetical protein